MSIFAKIFHKIEIEGVMPERALLRLKRVGVPLYAVKKTAKNRLTLRLRKRDLERAFALFPSAQADGFAAYKLTDFGAVGLGGRIEKLAQRTGLLLGGLLFAITTLYADRLVFSVEYVGTSVYARETRIALEQAGVKLFEYTPMQVKQSVVGYGKATKAQVMHMVQAILALQNIVRLGIYAEAGECVVGVNLA